MSGRRVFLHRWLLLAALALSLAVLAACGGGDDDDDSTETDDPGTTAVSATPTEDAGEGTPIITSIETTEPTESPALGNPCSLLTPEDIEAVLGGDFSEGVLDTNGDCTWADPELFEYVFLEVGGANRFDADVEALSMEEFEGGPGDRAAWAAMFRTLDVLDGNRTLALQVGPNEILEPKAEAIALMEKALD